MRVVIAEDEPLMRHGLVALMTGAGLDVVATTGDGDGLMRETRTHRPDLVVTDVRMPPDNRDSGLRAALWIRNELPGVAVMVLSHHVQRAYMTELLRGEAAGVGYLLKQRVMDADGFFRDLNTVAEGGTVLDPEVVSLLVSRARSRSIGALTDRQEDVLGLMARGLSNAAIARELNLQERSVIRHVSHIYGQLGLSDTPDAHRRVQAVVHHLWS